MTTSTSCCPPSDFGLIPISIKWTVVRGDTAELLVDFLENDEVTAVDFSTWTFASSTYDPREDAFDELEVTTTATGVKITAPSEITQTWGSSYSSVVAELTFDLEVTYNDSVWTPIVGIIKVVGDVSGGGL